MPTLAVAWLSGVAFAASLGFFLYSYWFRFSGAGGPAGGAGPNLVLDLLLFTAFALHHSVFARTGLKRAVSRLVSPPLERSVYALTASVLFFVVCWVWRPLPGRLYELDGAAAWAARAVGAAGVLITAIGARALDALDLAGIRQVQEARGASPAPRKPLKTDGVYGFVRHPLYFAWILLMIGVAEMTYTRLTFAVISTAYLALAIPFEERSLVETFGPDYASYRQRTRWRMIPGLY